MYSKRMEPLSTSAPTTNVAPAANRMEPLHTPANNQSRLQNKAMRTGRFKFEAPWIILIALLLATLLASYQSYQRSHIEAQNRFNEKARDAQLNIVTTIHNTIDLLLSASALVASVPKIEPLQLHTFFDAHLGPDHSYRGLVQAIYVSSEPKNPIRFKRDFQGAAGSSFDRDLGQHPAMVAAMAFADETKKIAATDLLQVTDNPPAPASMIALVLPVYAALRPQSAGAGDRPSLLQLKQRPPIGHFIALMRLDDVLGQVNANLAQRLSITLLGNNQLLYSDEKNLSSRPAAYFKNFIISPGQRPWNLQIDSTPALEAELTSEAPSTILLVGILGTLLLAGLVWLLTRLRDQAEALAKRMTEKLQDQVKFTEDLIELNPNPIFRKDAEGRFTAVNRAWEQLSGRNRKEVLGKANLYFNHADTASPINLADKDFSESTNDYEVSEASISNADGQKFETIISKQILRRADGVIDGLIGTITDISQKRKLEQELRQQREQLDLVIRSSQQGIWDIELKPGGRTYFSEHFFEMLGYSDIHPLRYNDWREQFHPDDVDKFAGEMVRHFKRQTPYFDAETRVRKQSGEYTWVRVRALAQHNDAGRAVRFVGSIIDISARKDIEAAMLEANQRIVEAARAKAAFLATMSHEIRTPLNGVLGITGLLSETLLNDEQRDYIRLINASGDTLLRLIDDVLDFSKIESGRMTLETIPVEIIPLVEEAFEIVAEKARQKQIALIYDIREDVPFYILGDATRIRQILLNMLSNALKFTEHGEIKLTISARRTPDGKLELEGRVNDTGIGIPADRLAMLFQPFTQADASTTRKYGGTGLGLAIIRRLTKLMHGDVRVESVEGVGTTFIFTIITQTAHGLLNPYMQRNVPDFIGKHLLLVESRVSHHDGMRHFLNAWGFQTTTVIPEDAAKALQAEPDTEVILSDMVLPSGEATRLQKAMDKIDAGRKSRHQQPIVSILFSTYHRQDLHKRNIISPLRHDILLLRPCGRAKIFDALMKGILRELNAETKSLAADNNPENGADTGRKPVSTGTALDRNDTGLPAPDQAHVLNILVAEDNEINQRVICGMLNNLSQRVTLVENGRLAVAAATTRRFDLILMDIHMPELDGISAMQEIRAHFIGQNCPPIVAMTAHAMAGDREQYLAKGMDDYLSKPIKMAGLTELLVQISDRLSSRKTPTVLPTKNSHFNPIVNATAAPLAMNISTLETIPILDKEQLEDLRYLPAVANPAAGKNDGSKTDAVTSLISLFQTKAIERLNIMETCLRNRDWQPLADTAHSLRGASASIGFPRVALLCKDLELGARQLGKESSGEGAAQNQVALGKIFTLIRHHYHEADTALSLWLAESSQH